MTIWIVALNVVALAALGLIALATANLLWGPLSPVARRVVQRQALNIVLVGALAVAALVVPDTSGQAIDSIRSWAPLVDTDGAIAWSTFGAARFLTGLAAALLLAVVIYECAMRLTSAPSGSTEPPIVGLGVFAGLFLVLGIVGWWPLPFGPGVFLLGVALLLILVLEAPRLGGTEHELAAPAVTPLEARIPEWLAITPLLALAATSVAAVVDAGLSGGTRLDAALTAIPAIALGLFAILMTSEAVQPPTVEKVGRRSAVVVFALIVVSAVLLSLSDEIVWAAVFGGAWLLVLIAYASSVMGRIRPKDWDESATPQVLAYAAPAGFGAGFAALIAIHLDPVETGRTLGVFALANVALVVAALFFLRVVRRTLYHRPPRLLWWFGFEQLPVLSIFIVWWVAVGAVGILAPSTLHDVRLASRVPIENRDGETVIPPRPDLATAFESWVAAQPELRAESDSPVPLVLVAAHGGGIRAAYWTVSALDCLIAIAPPAPAEPISDDEGARALVCENERRNERAQAAAARKVFLMSGVSGGAVGLYGYARQLLHNGSLGDDGNWVDARFERDFAAPAVGWALFHDIPNRLFGVRYDAGGTCPDGLDHGWHACLANDRAAVLEDAFDSVWNVDADEALLRLTYDLRQSRDDGKREKAQLVPLFVGNATLTGGNTRAVITAANLGQWPLADTAYRAQGQPAAAGDPRPLAGTIEISDALCGTHDVRLSSAAILAARFPYVTPSGHVAGRCARGNSDDPVDDGARCGRLDTLACDGSYVDGGYAENSGLFTIVALWPALRELIEQHNASGARPIAPVIVELDNHYQPARAADAPSGGSRAETTIPLETAFGARNALQTYARNEARRFLPADCMVTLSPRLHPGLIAPLGWELSRSAREDLRGGLTESHVPGDTRQLRQLRRLQAWLGSSEDADPLQLERLRACARRVAGT